MRALASPALVFAAAWLGTACDRSAASQDVASDSLLLSQRVARFEAVSAQPDSSVSDKPIALWKLPNKLKESSGLALTRDGRLLTHGDEMGRIFEVDYRRGVLVKEFTVGSPVIRGDFEAITLVGDTIWLATNSAVLYRFPEGADGESVPYTTVKTGLGKTCEFEGMAFDSASHSLLLACKSVYDKALKDVVVIFRLSLTAGSDGTFPAPVPLTIPIAKVIGSNNWKDFHPSDITLNPSNGNYVMVASLEKGIMEVTPAGEVVFSRPLPKGHEMTEGLAISSSRILILSDEAKSGPARITLYRWLPQ